MQTRKATAHERSIALMRFLSNVARRLGVAEHVYIVGGAVRDFVLDRPIKDVDVVIDSVALKGKNSEWFAKQVVRAIPTKVNMVTNQYGVALLNVTGPWVLDGLDMEGEAIEIANARSESYGGEEGKGYKPHMVAPSTIEEDVVRRELTYNTLMIRLLDLASGPDKKDIVDLTGCGLHDLEEGVMRCPRDPNIVFTDDPSRMIRVIKFALRYGHKLTPDTKAAIIRNADKLKNVPSSHLAQLLSQIVLKEPTWQKALAMMADLGLIEPVREMLLEDQSFRSTLENHLKSQKMDMLFGLAEVGLPLGVGINFLTPPEQTRLREIALGMDRDAAWEFLGMVKNPGNAYKDKNFAPSLARKYGVKGKELTLFMQTIMAAGRELLLADPSLVSRPDQLKSLIEDRVERAYGRSSLAGESRVMAAEYKEQIPGGRARGRKPEDFDPKEIAMGIKVEQEHLEGGGYSKEEMEAKAREIAMDHLAEFPDYYTRLKQMEAEGEKAKKQEKKGGLLSSWDFTPWAKVAYEVYVDEKGYAHDDEGNVEYVGTEYAGETYGLHNQPWRGRSRPYRPPPAPRPPARVNQAQLDALDALLAKREDRFIRSLRDQVAAGRTLSDKQKSALRQNFYRARMQDKADLFRAASKTADTEGETAGTGTRVGLFFPLPDWLAEQYPDLGDEDDSPSHVTLLYVGEVPEGREEAFLDVVTKVVANEPGPIRAWTNGVDSFAHPHAERTVFYTPIRFSRDVAEVRDRIWVALEDAGFTVQHSFPLAFFPHTTLGYVDGLHHEHGWEGPVPNGAWDITSVQVWGLPKLYDIPFGTFDRRDIDLADLQRRVIALRLRRAWGPTG